ncbi:hypothetical protein Hdeb2414_s0103g00794481 [Helianthus debilis subsp. tardiflorus]
MPPRIRRGGRGKGPITTHNDHEAGPSHLRTPFTTMSAEPQRNRRNLFEPARRSVSHSSTPSYRHSLGPHSENEPDNPQPSYIPLQRSVPFRTIPLATLLLSFRAGSTQQTISKNQWVLTR